MKSKIHNQEIQRCINILSQIPEKDFIKSAFTDGKSKCCVIGHIKRSDSKDVGNYTYDNCADIYYDQAEIREISGKFLLKKYGYLGDIRLDISHINNYGDHSTSDRYVAKHTPYTSKKTKQNVMHLLNDMLLDKTI